MGTTKERGKYQGVSLPKDLVNEIKNFVIGNPKYRSIAEYTKQALREKMDRDLDKEFGTLQTPSSIKRANSKKIAVIEEKLNQILKELKKQK